MHALVRALAVAMLLIAARPAAAQYAEVPRPLPVPDGRYQSAAQIGRRLFLGGAFRRLAATTGSAVVVDPQGHHVPGAFPAVTGGDVRQIVPDGIGGWLLVGDFTAVGGLPIARFARVTPERTVDQRYRVTANGTIALVAVAHGRIYLAGSFSTINGAPRAALAALSATTGDLTAWGSGVNIGLQGVSALSASSIAVYVSGYAPGASRLIGLDAARGQMLFSRNAGVASIAATSGRVYLGGSGAARPVWAVDPLTGHDDPSWNIGLSFSPVSGTYGDYTSVNALLIDSGRLHLAGYFVTHQGHSSLAAVDVATGAPSSWRPAGVPQYGGLARVGPAIVAIGSTGVQAFDAASAALIPFTPRPFGTITTLAAAPEGVVIGGSFAAVDGVERPGLAAIDLDSGAIEPWTPALVQGPFFPHWVEELATDGTWLFARMEDARLLKIDPVSGAILGEHRLAPVVNLFGALRLAGGDLVTLIADGTTTHLGALRISDWTYRTLPVATDGGITTIDVDGDTLYVGGWFRRVNGQDRPMLAAVSLATGAVLPWRPAADSRVRVVRARLGRVWVGGDFHRVGGRLRRGLAELDATTGVARSWNPDVPVGFGVVFGSPTVLNLEPAADGVIYVHVSGLDQVRTVSGQPVPELVAFSGTTGRRLPWRPQKETGVTSLLGWAAITPDCLVVQTFCLPRAPAVPADLRAQLADQLVSLTWRLPPDASRTAVRLEAGSAEGRADLAAIELPADATSFASAAPRGTYFVRVRALAGVVPSAPTADVSFAVGPPEVPGAPTEATAVTEGRQVTVQWTSPAGTPLAYVFEAGTDVGRSDVGSLTLPGTATSFSLDAPVGRFFGRLRAVNQAGRSVAGGELVIDLTPRPWLVCNAFSLVPTAPTGLTATVVGPTVTLQWQQPVDGPIAESQHVVVGSAPGRSDLADLVIDALATSFAATAPPGTYYVRVGQGGCGPAAYSNEVKVVVP